MEDVAAVGGGSYLAWLAVPFVPVRIDALDAGRNLLQRLHANPWLGPSVRGVGPGLGTNASRNTRV
jgi:hypothetical protein